MAKYTVLFYNSMWDQFLDFSIPEIPRNFYFTSDRKYFDTANVVVFHMPSLILHDEIEKLEGQLWVFWSMESATHYPKHYDSDVLDVFDLFMTYKQSSDVFTPYLTSEHFHLLRQHAKPKNYFINSFISSSFDRSGRFEILSEMIKYIDVHSYGSKNNNREIQDDRGLSTKLEIIQKYKFTLALENAIENDYVTEKFYDPLVVGSIPVYLGAPNIEEYAPGKNCFINIRDYDSVTDLISYLKKLDDNEILFNKYLEWKKKPYKDVFLKQLKRIEEHPFVRMCKVIECKLNS